jgi:hypothetical protein
MMKRSMQRPPTQDLCLEAAATCRRAQTSIDFGLKSWLNADFGAVGIAHPATPACAEWSIGFNLSPAARSGLETGFRAATRGTRCDRPPKTQVSRQLQFGLWRLFKGILDGKAQLAQTRDEPVKNDF